MSNLGRAGGTRTHDPRIMSLHSNILARIYWLCFVPFRPSSTGRRVRSVPSGSVPFQRYRSQGPPAIVAAFRGHVPRARRAGGRDYVGWCHCVTPDAGGVARLLGVLDSSHHCSREDERWYWKSRGLSVLRALRAGIRDGLPLCLAVGGESARASGAPIGVHRAVARAAADLGTHVHDQHG